MWESFDNSIQELPIRRIDFASAEQRAQHDRLVELAESLEDAIAAQHEGGSSTDRSIASRRAEGVRDELDQLVLDLYEIDELDREETLQRGAPLSLP